MEIYALTPDPAATPIGGITASGDRAVLIGSERTGLSLEALDVGRPVRIPMATGVDSLNAAAAVAIACYSLR